ncbi:MAG: Ppx/GppA family phosphatase [Deltaproteobacteria bacterium]|nr:Ppx/GppA family phosphatase [Deltaproteobacteria bacterium]
MKLASIDIGTNTLRLLIGQVDGNGHIHDAVLKREITRLGGGFHGKKLHSDAKKRTLAALKGFALTLAEQGIKNVNASATSVIREAEDGHLFIDEIKVKTGIHAEVISGSREAALTLEGVLSALHGRERTALIFDIGGGSTEYIIAEKARVKGLKSLNMGVVSMTEKYLASDPPSQKDIEKISSVVEGFLAELKKELPQLPVIEKAHEPLLVGTAGTITTLAALHQDLKVYDSGKINNYVLTKQAIEALFQRLCRMTHSGRASIEALEEGRADLIIAGTIIVLKTMEEFRFNEMTISDYGLLEGLLIDLSRRKGAIP